jgi:hypothetical protein
MRTENQMLTDLHRLKIKMEGKLLKAKQWVMTPDGVGLLVGVDLIHPQSGQPYPKPMNVIVQGQSKMYAQDDVKACTFAQFCIQPSGFGQTPWLFMLVLVGVSGGAIEVGLGVWCIPAWMVMVGATFANWKRWFK